VLFCRRPTPGAGKRRLARTVGDEAAFQLAEALLGCAVEDAESWNGPVIVSPESQSDAEWATGLLRRRGGVVAPQPSGTQGERLNAVDARLRSLGFEHLLFIGSDAPSLQARALEAAAAGLRAVDVVLAPADDGGVTLMASRCPWPALSDLPWSTADLGQALATRCREAGRTVSWVEGTYDVDELADLRTAAAALAGDSRPARSRLRAILSAVLAGASP
jgi:uncharacterized protein